jgi:hypothetical protein
VPHPRHRYAAADVLGVEEAVMWPDAVRTALKTNADREVVSVYPYRSACPHSLWGDLLAGAKRELTLAGYTNYFLWLEQRTSVGCCGARLSRAFGCGSWSATRTAR